MQHKLKLLDVVVKMISPKVGVVDGCDSWTTLPKIKQMPQQGGWNPVRWWAKRGARATSVGIQEEACGRAHPTWEILEFCNYRSTGSEKGDMPAGGWGSNKPGRGQKLFTFEIKNR